MSDTGAGTSRSGAIRADPSRFRAALADPAGFATLVELVPWPGDLAHARAERALSVGRDLAADPRIAALTVTDNAGGNIRLSPVTVARTLGESGAGVVVHVSCRDRSRGALTSLAWELASHGLTDLLALSGDYPVEGYGGLSRPVFDIDSVGLLTLLTHLGSDGPGFFAGAAVNPFKLLENELLPQLLKLAMKQRAGAAFTIAQVGWDVRAWDELLRWMRRNGVTIPALVVVYILAPGVARYFHAGKVPGCHLTDEQLAMVEREATAPDKGRGHFLELAAMQVAVARGLGFRGVYLAGQRDAAEIDRVLTLAAGYGPDDWRGLARQVTWARAGSFRLFGTSDDGLLATDEPSRAYARSLTPKARRRARLKGPVAYRAARLVHEAAFKPGTPGFRLGGAFYSRVEGLRLSKPLHVLEQAAKVPLFECRDCGDCSLPEIAYLCPESQCVKNQRNGPCGGTRDGQCEVPGRPCIWSRAYDRVKPYGEELAMLERPPTLGDNALRHTSAWANTYLGRDHVGAGVHPGTGGRTGQGS